MTPSRRWAATHTYPSALEIVTTGKFDAPIALVFDVLTKPEHVSKWFPPFACVMTECSIDLRVGGDYHFVFADDDGTECSFRGTYLEIEPPTRTVQTWLFEGWPDAHAVETTELQETDGVTNTAWSLLVTSIARASLAPSRLINVRVNHRQGVAGDLAPRCRR